VSQLGLATTLPSKTPAPQRRRTIPFDYQFYFKIFDEKNEARSFLGQTLTSTLTVSIEAAFVAVSIGYGFVSRVRTFAFGPDPGKAFEPVNLRFGDITKALDEKLTPLPPGFHVVAGPRDIVTTGGVPHVNLGPLSERVLIQGIQINPVLLPRFLQVFQDGGTMGRDELAELFQAVEPPAERIQFLYALSDRGTGRSFQSEPLLNIAGLGISDGDRPFRYFATPIVFAPRSTIQLDVIPKTDFRGELYVTLHGYKVLGGAGTPTGHRLRGPAQVTRMRRR